MDSRKLDRLIVHFSTVGFWAALACSATDDAQTESSGGSGSLGGASGSGAGMAGSMASVAGTSNSAGAAGASGAGTAGTSGGAGSTGEGGTGGTGGGTGGAAGATVIAGSGGAGGSGGADPNFLIFLLIGQSNMEGVPQPVSLDQVDDPRVKVLAYDNCPNLARTYNAWYTARPPLHSCYAGVGPGDYFAKSLAEAFPNATVGLVPNAISGVDIDFFRKGVVSSRRSEFRIPPDNHWTGAYEWVIERARLAQQVGVIRGILFHQGESDNGNAQWIGKVSGMVADLRADLGLGDAPFLAGELLYSGCCAGHNTLVNQLPSQIGNAFAISAGGLAGMDQYHFDLAGQRELGRRYAERMLSVLSN
jgi:hypothetical protein